MKKIRVGVFMGGLSIEREVSLNSGRTICDHLDTAYYDVIPLFQTPQRTLYILPWHFLHRGKITDFEHRLSSQAEQVSWDALKDLIDFMYIAMHGRYAEDGTLQGMLEIVQIPYLGSGIFASALGMNKIMQKEILQAHGIATPAGIVVTPDQITHFQEHQTAILQELTQKNITFPVVVKPNHEGSSFGISIIKNPDQLYDALVKAATIYPHKQQEVLVEEKIQGMEFSCISFMDEQRRWMPLPPTEVVSDPRVEYFDYEQKYMPGRATEFTPPRQSPENIALIQDTCARASTILEMETISRIDGFLTPDNRVIIIDPNTLSGMGPSSFLFREAAHLNWSHTQVINYLIETELSNYGLKELAHNQKESSTMNKNKTRIGVVMGGRSNEKEISLESGRNITYKLSPHNYEAIPIFVTSRMELYRMDQVLLVRNATAEIEELLTPDKKILWNELPRLCDFVFIALHGGEGENGAVQGALEMLGLPYNGSSVLASALCMDKFKTTHFLQSKGFDVPRSLLISKEEWLIHSADTIQRIMHYVPFPFIIKPHDDGCSVMVKKISNEKELSAALHTIFTVKQHAMVEEFITGMELTVGIIGNNNPKALPPSQAVATGDILSIEEKFLPGAGENQTPAPLPAAALSFVQYTVEQVFKAVGCKGYARIDCFYQNALQSPTGKERTIILEINTLPGMTPATCIFHQAAELGIRPMNFIDHIITLGFEEHAHRQHRTPAETETVATAQSAYTDVSYL